jgi:CheY-like chemotaxis protein
MAAHPTVRDIFNEARHEIARAVAACKTSFCLVEKSRRLRRRRGLEEPAPLSISGSLAAESAGCSQPLAGVDVLLVEDDEDTRFMMVELLRFCGARVVGMSTALDALTHLEIHLPNVMITDLSMPGMDGIELVDRIKQNICTRRLPVIAMTAFPAGYLPGAQRKFNAFLRKPVDLDELVKQIRAVTVDVL